MVKHIVGTGLAVIVALAALVGCSRQPATRSHAVVFDFIHTLPRATSHPAGQRGAGTGAGETAPTSLPRFDPAGGGLLLPFGSRLDYFLRLPPESRIAIEEIITADPRADLRISMQLERQDERVVAELIGSAGRQEIAIPGDQPWPITGISFSALAQSESSSVADGVLLIRPVIESALPERPASAVERGKGSAAPGTNVIIYMTDAMRADHLGCYGYDRPTSPRIDAFAAESLLFEHAIAQAPWTTSSVSSMMTGVYPNTHHVTLPQQALPASLKTMGEILHTEGFTTAAFVTNGAAGRAFGLARGFTHHQMLKASVDRRSIHELSDRVNEEVFAWLDGRKNDGSPLFLYVHTTDTHSPYTPPLEFARLFLDETMLEDLDMPGNMPMLVESQDLPGRRSIDKLIGLYDAEIAFNDHNFGEFIASLRDRGLYDDSLIIFLSDHGEEFYEHNGWQHMRALYAESVNIPLIVKLPGKAASRPGRAGILAQQVDVLPTTLTVLGFDIPPQVEGRDLIAALETGEGTRPARGFSYFDRRERKGVSVVDGDWKMIQIRLQDRPDPPPELYDIARDPGEQRDVAADHPAVVGYLESMITIHEGARTGFVVRESDIDEELRRELEALGYLD